MARGEAWATASVAECGACGTLAIPPTAPPADRAGLPLRWLDVLSAPPRAIFGPAGDGAAGGGAAAVTVRLPLAQGPVWHEFRDNWWALSPGLHLWVPTIDGLKSLAAANGLGVDAVVPEAPVDHFVFSELIARRVPPAHASAALISERERDAMRRRARQCRTESRCPEATVRLRRGAA